MIREGQGSALDPLRPSRLGVLRATAPDPILFVPVLAADGGGTPSGAFYTQESSGRLTTIGVAVLRTTTQRNGAVSDGLISMCGRNAGT
jgi:hypothetical protein